MMTPDAMGNFAVKRIRRAKLLDPDGKHIVSLHDLRRTGASLLAPRGAPESVVQDQLGHTRGSRITHEHYVESPDDALRDGWIAGAFE